MRAGGRGEREVWRVTARDGRVEREVWKVRVRVGRVEHESAGYGRENEINKESQSEREIGEKRDRGVSEKRDWRSETANKIGR